MSSEILYKGETIYKFIHLNLILGFEGIKSLNNDQFTNDPSNKPLLSIGQTHQFNTINREMVAPFFAGTYEFDNYLLSAKAETIISGKSTDKGNTFSLGITWSFPEKNVQPVKTNPQKKYSVYATVIKVSKSGKFLKIDQGLLSKLEKGMHFDICQLDSFGESYMLASAIIYELGSDWAVLKLDKKFGKTEIKSGFSARGY